MHLNQTTNNSNNKTSLDANITRVSERTIDRNEVPNKTEKSEENETLVSKHNNTCLEPIVSEEIKGLNKVNKEVIGIKDKQTMPQPQPNKPLESSKSSTLLKVKNEETDHNTTKDVLNFETTDVNERTIASKPPEESIASISTNRDNFQPKYEGYYNVAYQFSNSTHPLQSKVASHKKHHQNKNNETVNKESSQLASTTIVADNSVQPVLRVSTNKNPNWPSKINTDSTYRESTQSRKIVHSNHSKIPEGSHEPIGPVESNVTFLDVPSTKLKAHEHNVLEKVNNPTEKISSKPKTVVTAFHEEINEQTLYVRSAKKLSSSGPLSISDLDDFLKKSKIDFEHFYYNKPISSIQITDFSFTKTLGVGAFGKVVLGELKKDKTLYAVKIIEKVGVVNQNHVKYVSNEKKILQALNFPFVINLKYYLNDLFYLYFVMPYIPGGSFYKYLKVCRKIKEYDAKFYIGQIVLALEYLHYLELIHRDIKTDNIMIDAFGYLKLVDFGQCIRCIGNNKTWTFTGTPDYMAPEIIVGKGYDCAVDWWALGIISFELIAGYRPFKHENPRKLQLLILCNQYTIPSFFSRALKKLIESLLVLEPKQRIANHIKKASVVKKHVWFKGMDWLALLNRTIEAPYLPNLQRSSPH